MHFLKRTIRFSAALSSAILLTQVGCGVPLEGEDLDPVDEYSQAQTADGGRTDGGLFGDGGIRGDGGVRNDGGVKSDGGLVTDGGLSTDGGFRNDAGVTTDGGTRPDAGVIDAGTVVPVELIPSGFEAQLANAGIDLNDPPEFDQLTSPMKQALMPTFAASLGVQCSFCHEDFSSFDLPRLRVAKKMWNNFVRELKLKQSGALYCDSCHQGQAQFLDRSAPLGPWMNTNFVGGLAKRDGTAHNCRTCHTNAGAPGPFLDGWAATP